MEIAYEVRPFDDEVRAAYLALLPEQAEAIEAGKLNWKFRDSPAGQGWVVLARDPAGEIIGMNGFAPARAKLGGVRAPAYQSMDTIVTPAARGKGVFTRLVQAFYDAQDRVGGTVFYGFPNDNSAPGFFNKLGWERLGSPPFVIKPLRSGYFARKVLGDWAGVLNLPLSVAGRPRADIQVIERFDTRADALWNAFSAGLYCAVDRAHDYLNWRIFDHPSARYRTTAIFGEHDDLRAFVTVHIGERQGGVIGSVMEALCRPDSRHDLQLLLTEAVAEMRAQGADAALAWCAPHSPSWPIFRRLGFLPMPEALRPIHLHFGGRALSPEGVAAMVGPEAWYLSYLDSDTL
jgi:GNAT superfamily N-acetyltransferase